MWNEREGEEIGLGFGVMWSRILRDSVAKKPDGVGLFGDETPITLCRRAPNSGGSLSCGEGKESVERII